MNLLIRNLKIKITIFKLNTFVCITSQVDWFK